MPLGAADAIELRARMGNIESKTLLYKRSNFATRLPLDCRYSPSHCWLTERNGAWRVGFTKFATRMLGEIVDHGFSIEVGSPVRSGQIVGWIEGFKAISDLFCVVDGEFRGGNPGLAGKLEAIDHDCYGEGWLYEAAGKPDSLCVDAEAYKNLLDKTIDKILEKQRSTG